MTTFTLVEECLNATHEGACFVEEHPLAWPDLWLHLQPEQRGELPCTGMELPPAQVPPPGGAIDDGGAAELLGAWLERLKRGLAPAGRRGPAFDAEGLRLIERYPDLAQRFGAASLFHLAALVPKARAELVAQLRAAQTRHRARCLDRLRDAIVRLSTEYGSAPATVEQIAGVVLLSGVGPGGWALVRLDTAEAAQLARAEVRIREVVEHLQKHGAADFDALWVDHGHVIAKRLAAKFGDLVEGEDVAQLVYERLAERGYAVFLRWNPAHPGSAGFLWKLAHDIAVSQLRKGKPAGIRILSVERTSVEIARRCREDSEWRDPADPSDGGMAASAALTPALAKRALAETFHVQFVNGRLTMRRLLILFGKLEGMTAQQIAARIGTTPHTVDAEYSTLKHEVLNRLYERR